MGEIATFLVEQNDNIATSMERRSAMLFARQHSYPDTSTRKRAEKLFKAADKAVKKEGEAALGKRYPGNWEVPEKPQTLSARMKYFLDNFIY